MTPYTPYHGSMSILARPAEHGGYDVKIKYAHGVYYCWLPAGIVEEFFKESAQ